VRTPGELPGSAPAPHASLDYVAGPKEAAAALGNVLVQARALGVQLETVADMRAPVRRTHELRRYEPVASADWDALESRLTGLRTASGVVQSAGSDSQAKSR